jgi:hypothetical protein
MKPWQWLALAAGGLWVAYEYESKAAPSSPAAPSGTTPTPTPATPPIPTMQTIVVTPGASTLNLPSGSGFTLALPSGASWPQAVQGYPPVMQPPGSVLGGSVSPLVPTGSTPQVWTNVTGQGSIILGWIDASNVLQTATIAITTTGSANTL